MSIILANTFIAIMALNVQVALTTIDSDIAKATYLSMGYEY